MQVDVTFLLSISAVSLSQSLRITPVLCTLTSNWPPLILMAVSGPCLVFHHVPCSSGDSLIQGQDLARRLLALGPHAPPLTEITFKNNTAQYNYSRQIQYLKQNYKLLITISCKCYWKVNVSCCTREYPFNTALLKQKLCWKIQRWK